MDTASREVAEQEFERFCEAMDLDVDTSKMDDEDQQGMARVRDKFVRAVMRGRLVINDAGEAVCLAKGPDGNDVEVKFSEPDGDALLALDKAKKGHAMQGMFLYMSKVTGHQPNFLSKLKKRDLDVCMAITQLFLG